MFVCCFYFLEASEKRTKSEPLEEDDSTGISGVEIGIDWFLLRLVGGAVSSITINRK